MASLYPNLDGAMTVVIEEDDFHSICNTDDTKLIDETDETSAPSAPSESEFEGYSLQNAVLKSLHLGGLLKRQVFLRDSLFNEHYPKQQNGYDCGTFFFEFCV